jgi:hypothetical protein
LVRYQQLVEDVDTNRKKPDATVRRHDCLRNEHHTFAGNELCPYLTLSATQNASGGARASLSQKKGPPEYDPSVVGPSFSGGLGSYFLDAIAGQSLVTTGKKNETDLTPALLVRTDQAITAPHCSTAQDCMMLYIISVQGVLVTPERHATFFTKWKLCGVQRVDWRGFARTRYG